MDSYIKDLITNIEKANLKLNSLKMQKDSKVKNGIVTELYGIQQSSDKIILKMDAEYSNMSRKIRPEFKGRIDAVKKKYQDFENEFKKMEERVKEDEKKENLLLKNPPKKVYENDEQILEGYNGLNITVKDIHTTSNDTYNNMTAAITNLKGQKDRIVRIENKTGDVEKELSLNDQIFEVLHDRESLNKLKLLGIIALLIVAIIIVLYIKF